MGKRFGYQYPHCHTITESNHHPNQFLRLQNLLSSPIFSSIQQSQLFLIGFQKKKNFGGPFSLTKQQKKKKKDLDPLIKMTWAPPYFHDPSYPSWPTQSTTIENLKKKNVKKKKEKKNEQSKTKRNK